MMRVRCTKMRSPWLETPSTMQYGSLLPLASIAGKAEAPCTTPETKTTRPFPVSKPGRARSPRWNLRISSGTLNMDMCQAGSTRLASPSSRISCGLRMNIACGISSVTISTLQSITSVLLPLEPRNLRMRTKALGPRAARGSSTGARTDRPFSLSIPSSSCESPSNSSRRLPSSFSESNEAQAEPMWSPVSITSVPSTSSSNRSKIKSIGS
mmetsp:Transcript_83620/g.194418  ORF Transcript_83620/g.194418 Transcript_83620/m.194418 type:complete len:211 (+) Transcript_83620:957-1589(+)